MNILKTAAIAGDRYRYISFPAVNQSDSFIKIRIDMLSAVENIVFSFGFFFRLLGIDSVTDGDNCIEVVEVDSSFDVSELPRFSR